MRTIHAPGAMQRLALRWKREGLRVGLVPTMGALHEGHLSLVQVARRRVGGAGKVVVSLYVNPTQFGPGEDLAAYPRDPGRDRALCRRAGVDVMFHPEDATMYPGRGTGGYSTYVVEESLSRGWEGASRPTHFRGVTTVVAKLFHLVLPDVAVFGAKDWQQAAVVRRMTKDLNFPVRLVVAPTRRERDGLAMSSRNRYLTAEQRERATVLWRAMGRARSRVRGEGTVGARELESGLRTWIEEESGGRVDYVGFMDPETLEPRDPVVPGTRLALAVRFGSTRLIDNGPL
ncbi:MAG: pantoate--beta-alanine ligase [Verrucomicrobiae bacterium]|nr:pantoate--beta-alanine ligase [Verrucomicrobiae bacterium]